MPKWRKLQGRGISIINLHYYYFPRKGKLSNFQAVCDLLKSFLWLSTFVATLDKIQTTKHFIEQPLFQQEALRPTYGCTFNEIVSLYFFHWSNKHWNKLWASTFFNPKMVWWFGFLNILIIFNSASLITSKELVCSEVAFTSWFRIPKMSETCSFLGSDIVELLFLES